MPPHKLIHRIKTSRLPYHVEDNNDRNHTLPCDEAIYKQLKDLATILKRNQEAYVGNLLDGSPDLQLTDRSNISRLTDMTTSSNYDRRNMSFQFKHTGKDTFFQTQAGSSNVKTRIKCSSLERVSLDDLSLFFRYKQALKNAKRTCDLNLLKLLETMRNTFSEGRNIALQHIPEEVSNILATFIFSTISELRFGRCRLLLQKLENIETRIHDQFNISSRSKISQPPSPLQANAAAPVTPKSNDKCVWNFNFNSPTEGKALNESFNTKSNDSTIKQGEKKVPNSTLKNVFPDIFMISPKSKSTKSNNGAKTPEGSKKSDDEFLAFRGILYIVGKAKYCMIEIGHFLQYDRISNPNVDALIKLESRKRQGNRGHGDDTPSPHRRPSHMPSLDLDADKFDVSHPEEFVDMKNLKEYFYNVTNFLGDLEDIKVHKRIEHLTKYSIWKMKRWYNKDKREKVEQKYNGYLIACKMCAQEVKISQYKDHLLLCKARADLNSQIKGTERKVSEIVLEAFLSSKRLHTELQIDSKNYSKLKRQYMKLDSVPSPYKGLAVQKTNSLKSNSSSSYVNSPEIHPEEPQSKSARPPKRFATMRMQSGFLEGIKREQERNQEFKEEQLTNSGKNTPTNHGNPIMVSHLLKHYQTTIDLPSIKHEDLLDRKFSMENIKHTVKGTDFILGTPSDPRKSSCSSEYDSDKSIDSKRDCLASPLSSTRLKHFPDSLSSNDSARPVGDPTSLERTSSGSQISSPQPPGSKSSLPYPKSKFYNNRDSEILSPTKDGKKQLTINIEEDEHEHDQKISVFDQNIGSEEHKTCESEDGNADPFNILFRAKTENPRGMTCLKTDPQIESPDPPLASPQTVEKSSNMYQISKDMSRLKKQIEKKKNKVKLYDFIMAKGKIVVNQEPNQTMLEVIKADCEEELKALNQEIKDKDSEEFANNFLSSLETRLSAGKKLQETLRNLNTLHGKCEDQSQIEAEKRKSIEKRTSIMHSSGRFGSPKANQSSEYCRNSFQEAFQRFSKKSSETASLLERHKRVHSNIDGLHSHVEDRNITPDKERPNELDKQVQEFSLNSGIDAEKSFSMITDKPRGSDKTVLTTDGDLWKSSDKLDSQTLTKLNKDDTSDEEDSIEYNEPHIVINSENNEFLQSKTPQLPELEEDNQGDKNAEEFSLVNNDTTLRREISVVEISVPSHLVASFGVDNASSVKEEPKKETPIFSQVTLDPEIETTPDFSKNMIQTVHVEPFMTPELLCKGSPQTPSFEKGAYAGWPALFGSTPQAKRLADMKKEMIEMSRANDLETYTKNLFVIGTPSRKPEHLEMNKPIEINPFTQPKIYEENHQISHNVDESPIPEEADEDDHDELANKRKGFAKQRSHSHTLSGPIKIIRGLDKNGIPLSKNGSLCGIPPDTPEGQDDKPKGPRRRRLSSSQLFEMLEDNADKQSYAVNRFPSLQNLNNDEEEEEEKVDASPNREKKKEKKQKGPKKAALFAEDMSNQDSDGSKEKIESQWLIESPVIDRGYHTDSHAKNVKVTFTKESTIGVSDFEVKKLISKGAFGKVFLVKRKVTNDYYALKVVNLAEKAMKNNMKELENLRKETKILGMAKEDYVVRKLFSFTHETSLFIGMEYIIGGDFGDILHNYVALDEPVAKFYIAEIVLALEYIHSLGIVHRDLKPDNVLLDKYGHAKLTDFGLSEGGLEQRIRKGNLLLDKEIQTPRAYKKKFLEETKEDIQFIVNGKTMEKKFKGNDEGDDKKFRSRMSIDKRMPSKRHQRLIGTPDYMAPEIIQQISITNFSIDWWSLGVMLFEFLVGVPPFNDDSEHKIYDNILKRKIPWDQIEIGYEDNQVTPEAEDLINKLLTLDHTKRLGANGADEIKQHKFFKDINWDTLRKEPGPIIPEQKSPEDTSNFVRMNGRITDKDRENPLLSPKKQGQNDNALEAKMLLEKYAENFHSYDYDALYSETVKLAEEILKQKEKELKQCDDVAENDVFDEGILHDEHEISGDKSGDKKQEKGEL